MYIVQVRVTAYQNFLHFGSPLLVPESQYNEPSGALTVNDPSGALNEWNLSPLVHALHSSWPLS